MKPAQPKVEGAPTGRPFEPGNKPAHDVAAAGRKGKENSPWRNHPGLFKRHGRTRP